MVKEQRAAKIRLAIEQLSPKYRSLIELRYLEELSYEEIAEKLDLPLGTVKAQLFRAKDMLYNTLKVTKEKY
jgi:RNA polymerase sigma-70 factor (ECF subfamily)